VTLAVDDRFFYGVVMELIKIENRNGKETVNARELHEFLESKQEFSSWIKNRISKYGFIENEDYTLVDNFIKQVSGTKHLKDYYLSIDMAKELSMVENNEKGKQARRYFIEVEKKSLSQPLNGISELKSLVESMIKSIPAIVVETVKAMNIQTNQPVMIEPSFYSLKAYMIKNKLPIPDKSGMIILGKEARKISVDMNQNTIKVPDEQYGEVNGYHISVLTKLFSED
jgi:anti-repressor protein